MEVVQEMDDEPQQPTFDKGDQKYQDYLDLAGELSSDDDVEPQRPTDSMKDYTQSREVTFQDYMVN